MLPSFKSCIASLPQCCGVCFKLFFNLIWLYVALLFLITISFHWTLIHAVTWCRLLLWFPVFELLYNGVIISSWMKNFVPVLWFVLIKKSPSLWAMKDIYNTTGDMKFGDGVITTNQTRKNHCKTLTRWAVPKYASSYCHFIYCICFSFLCSGPRSSGRR